MIAVCQEAILMADWSGSTRHFAYQLFWNFLQCSKVAVVRGAHADAIEKNENCFSITTFLHKKLNQKVEQAARER